MIVYFYEIDERIKGFGGTLLKDKESNNFRYLFFMYLRSVQDEKKHLALQGSSPSSQIIKEPLPFHYISTNDPTCIQILVRMIYSNITDDMDIFLFAPGDMGAVIDIIEDSEFKQEDYQFIPEINGQQEILILVGKKDLMLMVKLAWEKTK